MKKYIYTLLAFAAVMTISCQKEDNNTIDENNGKEVITAVVKDELVTKGDYVIGGTTATFSWTTDDEFYRFVRADNGDGTYGNYNHYTYQYSSGSGKSVVFSGSPVGSGYADTGYALYPSFKYRTDTGATFGYYSSSDLYLHFSGTIAYNSANPLKNIVPMLGKLDGTTYTFKPLTGVIAVPVSNIPATANKVVLSTTDQGLLNGYSARFCNKTDELGDYYIEYYLGPDTKGLRKCWISGTSATYTFDAGSITDATFYFPIATSYNSSEVSDPYTNFTISVKNGDDELASVSKSGLSITVDRAEIVALPTINCNYAGTKVTAAVTGTPSDIKAYFTTEKGTVTNVRAAAIASKTKDALNTAIPNSTSGTDITAGVDSGSAVTVADGFSTSGQYYIGIKAFNGTTEVGSYIVSDPVYFLSATDYAKLVKEHTMSYTNGNGGAMTYGTMTLTLSDDLTKGQFILSDFDGMTSTSSTSRLSDSHTFFKAMTNNSTPWMGGNGSAYPFTSNATNVYDGNTYYGILDSGTLSFATNINYPLFNYSVNGNSSNTAKIILFSNEGSTSDSPETLSFAYDGSTLSLTHTYIVVRFIGYFYNGSTVTSSGGYASKPYASNVSITL